MKDAQRLNVAITRSRFALVVIGCPYTLSSDICWQSFIDYIRQLPHELLDGKVIVSNSLRQIEKRRFAKLNLEDYDSAILDGTTRIWDLVFSDDLRRNFANLGDKMRESVLVEIIQLSQGLWRKSNLLESNLVSPAYRNLIMVDSIACKPKHLLWTIDLRRKGEYEEHFIRIWDIVSDRDLQNWVKRLEREIASFANERREKIVSQTSRRPVKPSTFAASATTFQSISLEVATEDLKDANKSLGLMKFYDVTPSVISLLRNSTEGECLEFLHTLSFEEESLVNHEGSIFILGRSGTGTDPCFRCYLTFSE